MIIIFFKISKSRSRSAPALAPSASWWGGCGSRTSASGLFLSLSHKKYMPPKKINKFEFESFRTICKQKYTYRTLLALNEEGEEVVDHFKFPSCCVCHQVERTFFCGQIQIFKTY